ncbi:MAG: hypothetical protein K0Q48_673 [Bacillota bacterium]|jgi:hypothetical protein|nr:hypothetical protein [Bacillota bacterium]
MNIKFAFEKETKGAVRFKEQSDKPIVGTLYIKKEALPELDITKNDELNIKITRAGLPGQISLESEEIK